MATMYISAYEQHMRYLYEEEQYRLQRMHQDMQAVIPPSPLRTAPIDEMPKIGLRNKKLLLCN